LNFFIGCYSAVSLFWKLALPLMILEFSLLMPDSKLDPVDSHSDIMAPDGLVNPIDTDYQVGQDNVALNIGPFGLDIHNRVFLISGLAIVAFVILTLVFQNDVAPVFGNMRSWITTNLDWFFLLSGNIFVLVCLFLIVSPMGKVRIGGTEAKPDYGYLGWFSMLFAAGMGIGLMFYGVSEPLSHFGSSLGGATVVDGVRTDWAPFGWSRR
jgi:BCCT family betaine/carnitine transporter